MGKRAKFNEKGPKSKLYSVFLSFEKSKFYSKFDYYFVDKFNLENLNYIDIIETRKTTHGTNNWVIVSRNLCEVIILAELARKSLTNVFLKR